MNIDYNLVHHFRDAKTHKAPPEIKEVHPLGKSPTLVTPSGLALAESSSIATFLLNTYDTELKFHEGDIHSDAFYVEDSLVSLTGATLGPLGMIKLLMEMSAKASPFPLNYLMSFVTSPLNTYFTVPESKKVLSYLENTLGEKDYFGGTGPKKADFMLSFPCDLMVHRGWFSLDDEFPRLAKWRQRILERDAWKRALSKGNGYNLNNF